MQPRPRLQASAIWPPQGAARGQQHPGRVPGKVTAQAAPNPASQAELTPTAAPTSLGRVPAPRAEEPCVVLGGENRAPAPQDNPRLPQYDPAAGEKGDGSSSAQGTGCFPGQAAVPTWEEVSLAQGTCFPGTAAAPAPSLGLGSVSPAGVSTTHVGREAWGGLPACPYFTIRLRPIPQLVADAPSTLPSPSEGWAGQGGWAQRQEEGRVAALGAEPTPSVCRTAAPPYRPVFQLIGFI